MEQLQLLLRDQKKEVSVDAILAQPTFKAALALCKSVSGLEDKQICGALDIDAAQFSRIFGNGGNFPEDKLLKFMTICGNVVPLIWLAYKCGYGIYRLKSEVEMENERLRAELDGERKRLESVTAFLRDIGARI
jgi:hypothetical protein